MGSNDSVGMEAVTMLSIASYRASQRYGFVFHFLQVSSGRAGLNRQDRSLRYSGGRRKDLNNRAARQSLVSNDQSARNVYSGHQQSQNSRTRMTIASKCPSQSSPSHWSHQGRIMYKINSVLTPESPVPAGPIQNQYAQSTAGRQCTEMALTWPGLVRIERFQVRWLPCGA